MRWVPLVLLAACGAPADDDSAAPPGRCPPLAPPAVDLDAVAGTRTLTTSWVVPWTGEERTIDLQLWYPTDDTVGEGARWLDVFPDDHSFVDAQLRAGDCRLPVVVYSHGSQAWAGNGSDLMRQLARQGYLVVAPDHKDNTLIDNLDPKPATFSLTRVRDVVAALDVLDTLPAEDPLAGRFDPSRVLVTGHSFGGQTSWLFAGPQFDPAAIDIRCAQDPPCTPEQRAAFDVAPGDPRVVAVAPMAGDAGVDLVSDGGWAAMHGPVLYFTGTEDFDGAPQFERTGEGEVTWVEVEGACHESFTSTALSCSTLDKEAGLTLVGTWLQAFAARTLLGSSDPSVIALLDGATSISPLATVHHSASAQ